MGRSGSAMHVYIDTSLREAFGKLAEANQRTLAEEIAHAMIRHLEKPPKRKIKTTTPELREATVEDAPARPKAPRGRPRKQTPPDA